MDKQQRNFRLFDLIERVRNEKLLRQSRELFKTVFDHVPIAMILISNDRIIHNMNHAAIKMFFLHSENYWGKSIDDYVHRKLIPKEVKTVCSPRQRHHFTEIEFINNRQQHQWFNIIATKIKPSNNHIQWLIMLEDISLIVRAKQLHRTISQRIIQAHEDEKLLISREIHDTISQSLAALKMSIQTNASKRQLVALVDQLIQTSRTLSQDLRPDTLDDLGLIPALRHMAENISQRFGTKVMIKSNSESIYPQPQVSLQLYRIAQEAVLNAAKHGQAPHVNININLQHDLLRMSIQDDGIGFDYKLITSSSKKSDSLGLKIMAERAAYIGAEYHLQSRLGFGTKIKISCDLKKHNMTKENRL